MESSAVIKAVGFVHLHVHSAFSLREGALTIETLAKLAKADDMPALAITDTNNLFGALEFSEKLAKAGVQPIVGMQATIDFGDAPPSSSRLAEQRLMRASIVLLAQNETGYRHLMRLASSLWLDPREGDEPHVPFDSLVGCEGLIALTGGPAGPIDRALGQHMADLAESRLRRLASAFDRRLYVELQRHGIGSEAAIEPALIDLADRFGLPLVATNEPYFAARSDYEAHDALLCVAEGTLISASDRRRLSTEHRFKTRAEMTELFADLTEATEASVEIAMRCAYRPLTRKPILPRFSVPGGDAVDEEQELRRQAHEGLEARLAHHGLAPGYARQQYDERLAFELDVIVKMKFPGYFLIVADFIKWAKAQEIPVGPGRGSGAGSLVAWALTITDLDPMRFGLLFERFLNPERVSMPDFDIDFCQDRRDEVIAYVRERYGADRVAQIITFGSFLARGVMRNVGRVLEMPLGQVDKLAKLVPMNPAHPVTLKQAVADEARLQDAAKADERVGQMLAIAERLEGLYSNASTYAAGVVIGDRPLTDLVPLYRDPKAAMPATQFNMKWVEPAGLVKFDFLGLKTLTTLQRAIKLIYRRGNAVDLGNIPLDDAKTYEMLGRGETVGVFQVESAGMRKALVEMRADRFEDIIALVALYRPGPMANIPTYCARKLGHEKPDTIHPTIEPVLRETFGVIIYQEQVMQIAQVLSGYSLGEADMLRRAMGKKIKKEMDAQRARFVDGAVERGTARTKADEIFDLLAKFADYGFNKSSCGGLCADRLLDRLVQGEPPGRIPRRLHDPRQGQYRQARRVPCRGAAARHRGRSSFGQRLSGRFRRARRRRWRRGDRLCSERHQGGGRSASRGARQGARRKTVRLARRHRRPARSAPGQQEGAREPRGGGHVRRARARPGPGLRRDRADAGDRQRERFGKGIGAERPVRRYGGSAAESCGGSVDGGRKAQARVRRGRLLSLGAPVGSLQYSAEAAARRSLGGIRPLGARRRDDCAVGSERARPDRAAHQERLEDGHRAALRPVGPVRGDHLSGSAEPVPRPARERRGRAGDAPGERRGRGRARPHRQR